MNRILKLLIGCVLTLWLVLATPHRSGAQGGCFGPQAARADRPPVVVQVIKIAAGVIETPSQQTPNTFRQVAVSLGYQPGQAIWLSANSAGTGRVCVDDLLAVRNLTTGQTWQHDFRSPDRTRIVSQAPVNLAGQPGLGSR